MAIVLLGDSHLARVRRDLDVLGPVVRNLARGGSTSRDLAAQVAGLDPDPPDAVVLSVGTNDAAGPGPVPVAEVAATVRDLLAALPVRRVLLAPPGVDETRSAGLRGRTNDDLDRYRDALVDVGRDVGAAVVRTDLLLAPLGAGGFADDGLHLSGGGYAVVLPAIAAAVRDAG